MMIPLYEGEFLAKNLPTGKYRLEVSARINDM